MSYGLMRRPSLADMCLPAYRRYTLTPAEDEMGKYFIGWILGVPAVVLVGIYLVTHVL